jgi:hypothetical protein
MTLKLESLATELYFEIFQYLSPFDLFRAFSGLNSRFEAIVGSFSLELDFQSISRSRFDFICRHVQPEQVISLTLSDNKMPDQVNLFFNHFPQFQHEFIRLRKLTLIDVNAAVIVLPSCVSSLSFIYIDKSLNNFITETIFRQSKVLTHLRIPTVDVFLSLNTPLRALTHLTIGSSCHIAHYNGIIARLESPITHLNARFDIFDETNNVVMPDFKQLSNCLTHLSIYLNEIRGR